MKKIFVSVLLTLVVFLNVTSESYAFFDALKHDKQSTIRVGDFTFSGSVSELSEEIIDAFKQLFGYENVEDLYEDPEFIEIMDFASRTSQGGGGNTSLSFTVFGVKINSVEWNVMGQTSQTAGNRSIGFLREIDRSLNADELPVHPVMPPAASSSEANYPEYSFFKAYDVKNTATNNTASLRLENVVSITTSLPVKNFNGLEFYALRGLQSTSSENLGNRTFEVLISADGSNFERVGSSQQTVTPNSPVFNANNLEGQEFPFYSFMLSTSQLNTMPEEGYYVRLAFNGNLVGGGGNGSRSRVVIDDLQFIIGS